jgi:hypothetical protein
MPRVARLPLVFVAASVALAGLLLSATASAQNVKPAYKKAYEAGEEAYTLGKFEDARKLFEKARDLQPELPGAYRWLAEVANKQKRYEDCLTSAYDYLERTSQGGFVDVVRKIHADCRASLNRARFQGEYSGGGAISVTASAAGSSVDGAIVRINGLRAGATPLAPRTVAAGKTEISLEAARYLPAKVEVNILEGIVLDVHIEMEVDPNAKSDVIVDDPDKEVEIGWLLFSVDADGANVLLDGAGIAPDERGRVEKAPGVYTVEVTAAGRETWKRRVRVVRGQERTIAVVMRERAKVARDRKLGWISLGVATAATGAGIFFSIREHDAREQAQDIYFTERTRNTSDPQTDLVPLRTREDMQDAIDRAKSNRLGAALSFGVAAAALGTSIYFFIQERPEHRRGFELPMAIAPIPGDGGIAGVGATYSGEFDW